MSIEKLSNSKTKVNNGKTQLCLPFAKFSKWGTQIIRSAQFC